MATPSSSSSSPCSQPLVDIWGLERALILLDLLAAEPQSQKIGILGRALGFPPGPPPSQESIEALVAAYLRQEELRVLREVAKFKADPDSWIPTPEVPIWRLEIYFKITPPTNDLECLHYTYEHYILPDPMLELSRDPNFAETLLTFPTLEQLSELYNLVGETNQPELLPVLAQIPALANYSPAKASRDVSWDLGYGGHLGSLGNKWISYKHFVEGAAAAGRLGQMVTGQTLDLAGFGVLPVHSQALESVVRAKQIFFGANPGKPIPASIAEVEQYLEKCPDTLADPRVLPAICATTSNPEVFSYFLERLKVETLPKEVIWEAVRNCTISPLYLRQLLQRLDGRQDPLKPELISVQAGLLYPDVLRGEGGKVQNPASLESIRLIQTFLDGSS